MPSLPQIRRFGVFSFDTASGELRGAAGTTRLQPQVAALLEVLTEHAGTVVTRAELRTRLWPETTVEFDDGLNFCVRQLRVALGDDANAPTYIETLPKRGYRFLPAVTADSPGAAPEPAQPRRRRPGIVWAASAAAVVLGTILLWQSGLLPGRRAAGSRVALAVLPFTADTTDPMMAEYRQRLFSEITGDARSEPSWNLLAPLAPGATHVLSGSLERDGPRVKVFVHLVAAGDRHTLWADDLVDLYAFSGNSKLTADRIEKNVARILVAEHPESR